MAAKKEPKQTPGERLVADILAEMAESQIIPDSKESALLVGTAATSCVMLRPPGQVSDGKARAGCRRRCPWRAGTGVQRAPTPRRR